MNATDPYLTAVERIRRSEMAQSVNEAVGDRISRLEDEIARLRTQDAS
jgi:hypothetical protein